MTYYSQAEIAATISQYVSHSALYDAGTSNDEHNLIMMRYFEQWPEPGGFLALLDEDAARRALMLVVGLAQRLAGHDHRKCTWHTHPNVLSVWQDAAEAGDRKHALNPPSLLVQQPYPDDIDAADERFQRCLNDEFGGDEDYQDDEPVLPPDDAEGMEDPHSFASVDPYDGSETNADADASGVWGELDDD